MNHKLIKEFYKQNKIINEANVEIVKLLHKASNEPIEYAAQPTKQKRKIKFNVSVEKAKNKKGLECTNGECNHSKKGVCGLKGLTECAELKR